MPCASGESDIAGDFIVSGIDAFEFRDEHYFVSVRSEETRIFLRSKSNDGESIAGWCHQFGQGRVCCITPAHSNEALRHEQMQRLLARSLAWCVAEQFADNSNVNVER